MVAGRKGLRWGDPPRDRLLSESVDGGAPFRTLSRGAASFRSVDVRNGGRVDGETEGRVLPLGSMLVHVHPCRSMAYL